VKAKPPGEAQTGVVTHTETLLMIGRASFHLNAAISVMTKEMRMNPNTAGIVLSSLASAALLKDLLYFCGDPERVEQVRLRLERESKTRLDLGPCIMEH
jgi:hypothetical protein